jgi:hypothetical protein
MLPNFLVVGAEKAATTWLYNRLKDHPEIYLPETKEVHFFNKFDSNLKEIDRFERMGLGWYEQFFRNYNKKQAIGEVTPMYLCDPEAPFRIKKVLPDVKIIMVLRDPIDRAYSHYWMAKNKKHTQLSFEEAVDKKEPRFIQRGLYHKQLRVFLELFPIENIKVILFEDIKKNNIKELSDVYSFLGVNNKYIPEGVNNKENSAQRPKSILIHRVISGIIKLFRVKLKMGWAVDIFKSIGLADKVKMINSKKVTYEPINKIERNKLKEYYHESNEKLEKLLNRDLNW